MTRNRRLLLAGLWLGALGYVAAQCAYAAVNGPLDTGYAAFAALFASLAIVGAYYVVVRSD